MTAWYNEIDPFAADWLENLILVGAIAPGVVDRRSIEDVAPSDLKGFTQCHFFAGIGGWSLALRQAGWSDDRPVWTGSCPCPPFSSAGKKKACPECGGQRPVPHVGRTGYFVCCLCGHEWLADGRHLWPEFWRIIRDERPSIVFGEQVAGADGLVWLDTIRASMEVLAYAVGAADLCAASIGAPHIRARTFWMAHCDDKLHDGCGEFGQGRRSTNSDRRTDRVVADSHDARLQIRSSHSDQRRIIRNEGDAVAGRCVPNRLVNSELPASERFGPNGREGLREQETARSTGRRMDGGLGQPAGNARMLLGLEHSTSDGREQRRPEPSERGVTARRSTVGMAHAERQSVRDDHGSLERPANEEHWPPQQRQRGGNAVGDSRTTRIERPGPTNGFWRDADWLGCRDDRWRPVMPGSFPLAHGIPNRVGSLRGYGNAIVVPLAQTFIEVGMEWLGATD